MVETKKPAADKKAEKAPAKPKAEKPKADKPKADAKAAKPKVAKPVAKDVKAKSVKPKTKLELLRERKPKGTKPKDKTKAKAKPKPVKENKPKQKEPLGKKPLKAGCYRIWKGKKEIIRRKNYIVKPIGGANNGNARRVLQNKRPAYYAAQLNKKYISKRKPKTNFKRLRPSITPGTVCIIVAGVHKGKKVVFLKRLVSGLCLVTGPFKINACPLRRVNQIYLIATATKLDVSKVEIPKHINDRYFRRGKTVRSKKEEGDIFGQKTEKYVASEQRKKDQEALDAQLISAIKEREDKKMFFGYLGSYFGLRNRMYPHIMKF
ncbi:60S ribosomal protein L6-like isoform X2 [Penaeus chinensis]|nr:60S ribosomal protein L6-like isoform X2 [Penaeus chinensis]XP_047501113.1 60S ribosomal protein L6-like isoform X2 [Penaeus chinensis]XP_047501114.1 60S ribosomal protein L6-like isoform X2 [Penaeus chinensis]